MHNGLLEGLEITLVGAHPHEKLGGGARIGDLIGMFQSRSVRINLISFLPYSNRFAIEHEKTDYLVNSVTICFPSRWPRSLKGLLLLAFNFAYTLKYSRASHLILTSCGSIIFNAPVIIASKLRRKPLIYDWLDLDEKIPEVICKYLMRQATTVLGLSYYLCEKARGYGCKNVVYAPCFVDTALFQLNPDAREKVRHSWRVNKGDIVIGYAGVLGYQEGVAVLLQAFKHLSIRYKNIRLAILGVMLPTTGEWDDVPQLTKALHLEDTVIIVPPVIHAEVPNILSACDVLCAPKLDVAVNRASIPVKVVEYLSMGLPTVTTTAVPELSRVVIDNVTGFLAEPGDVEDLETVLEGIILNPKHSQEVGRRGRTEVVKEFGIEAVGNTIAESLYTTSKHGTIKKCG